MKKSEMVEYMAKLLPTILGLGGHEEEYIKGEVGWLLDMIERKGMGTGR